MERFPTSLSVNNKKNFPSLHHKRVKELLRIDIHDHILYHEEKEYYSLDKFISRYNNPKLIKDICYELVKELEDIGWKCSLSFGDTGLFIYENDKPSNCYGDGF